MKNIPSIGSKSPLLTNILPAVEKVSASAEKAKISITDASVLSLPRTKANPNAAQGVETTLNSLLSGLEGSDLGAAHSGLDPARVSDLLNDD